MTDRIAEIKQRITVYDLCNRAGIEVKGAFIPSIYKQERTPSLKIYGRGESYYCFATNQGGDVIDFYEALYNVDTKTAVSELKALAGLDGSSVIKRERQEVKSGKLEAKNDVFERMTAYEKEFYEERLAIHLEDVANVDVAVSLSILDVKHKRLERNREVFEEFYYYCITKGWDEAAYNYLTKHRKIDPYQIENCKIFFIKNYNEVNNHLKKIFSLEQLQKSGLYNEKGNLIFYKHRIIIPYLYYKDYQLLYLRGRLWEDAGSEKQEVNASKYLGLINDALDVNTSKRFYNDVVVDTMIPGEPLYIVEGEFDAVILQQMGYNAICVPGAGNIPPRRKFQRLRLFNINICVDNDEAGSKLLNGVYYTPTGEKKYSDVNLLSILKSVGVDKVIIKKLPYKDVNEFVMKLGEKE